MTSTLDTELIQFTCSGKDNAVEEVERRMKIFTIMSRKHVDVWREITNQVINILPVRKNEGVIADSVLSTRNNLKNERGAPYLVINSVMPSLQRKTRRVLFLNVRI